MKNFNIGVTKNGRPFIDLKVFHSTVKSNEFYDSGGDKNSAEYYELMEVKSVRFFNIDCIERCKIGEIELPFIYSGSNEGVVGDYKYEELLKILEENW